MKIFSIKRITTYQGTKVYRCFLGKQIKLLYHYGIRYKERVILGAYHGIMAATKLKEDIREGRYVFTDLINN